MPWGCARCGRIHTQNPKSCRNCNHHVFSPISREDLPQNDSAGPQSIDPERLGRMSSAPDDVEWESSPDVRTDSSVAGADSTTESQSLWARLRSNFPF